MSPRAAVRLEAHGFGSVYDYSAGKADWLAAGFPSVQSDGIESRVIARLDPDPVVCAPDTPTPDIPNGPVVVVDRDHVVLGEITEDADRPSGACASDIMSEGPTTVRADEPLEPLIERMRAERVTSMIVTTPEGRLLGVVSVSGNRADVGEQSRR